MTEWVELEKEEVRLQKGITATIRVICPEDKPDVKLIAISKLFKSVAFKPEDWELILPILLRKVKDAAITRD